MKCIKTLIILLLMLLSIEGVYSSDNKQNKNIKHGESEVIAKDSKVVYQMPFGSSGNSIDLSVENGSSVTVENIKVQIVKPPSWIKFKTEAQTIQKIESSSSNVVNYIFSVEKEAPVNTKQTLNFNITSLNGEVWNKQITISVNPPETFELFQNYPNPFNPTTIISYQLPTDAVVNLKIYDILGREVATLINEFRKAGYYKESLDASNYASGVYFYKLQAGNFVTTKKMLLAR